MNIRKMLSVVWAYMEKNRKWMIPGLVGVLTLLLVLVFVFTQPKKIGLCFRDGGDPATLIYRTELTQALHKAGYRVIVMNAADSQDTQNQQIAELIQDKVDLLIVEPVDTKTLDTAECGMPLVFLNCAPEQLGQGVYIGSKPDQRAKLQAQLVSSLPYGGDINQDGTIACLVLEGPEGAPNPLPFYMFQDAIEDLDVLELFWVNCDWSEASGRTECTLALAEFGRDIEVVLCANASIALGAKQAISDRGYTLGADILVIATGDSEQLQKAILAGTVAGTVTQDMEEATSLLCNTVKARLKNKLVETKNYVNYKILDKNALS